MVKVNLVWLLECPSCKNTENIFGIRSFKKTKRRLRDHPLGYERHTVYIYDKLGCEKCGHIWYGKTRPIEPFNKIEYISSKKFNYIFPK